MLTKRTSKTKILCLLNHRVQEVANEIAIIEGGDTLGGGNLQ